MRDQRIVIGLAVAAGALAGCGGGDGDYANKPRPPAPINVTATITDDNITVSPLRFGAGPVVLLISNQTERARRVTIQTSRITGTQRFRQMTSPINPGAVATLKIDIRSGRYEVRVPGDRIRPATLMVGRKRESAQNELLQP